MAWLDAIGAWLALAALFSNFLGGAAGAFAGPLGPLLAKGANTAAFVLLLGVLALRAPFGLTALKRYYLWIPFFALFAASWYANGTEPKLALNLAFSFLKPFILGVAFSTFFRPSLPRRAFRLYLAGALLQIPFLAWQVAKLGYLTGGGADNYTGGLGDAHLVGSIAIVPSMWLFGRVYWVWREGGGIDRRSLAMALLLFCLPILCEAKYLYMGALLGMGGMVVGVERSRLTAILMRLLPVAVVMIALIGFFGLHFFLTLDYLTLFQFIQKVNAYRITLQELPALVPHALWLGAGPGAYGSAIAQKYLPPLTAHFFGEQIKDMDVGGTLMGPFSEINGALGELGALGPVFLLLPYVALLPLAFRRLRTGTDPFLAGALMAGGNLVLFSLLGTLFLPALVQHQIVMPAVALIALAARQQEGPGALADKAGGKL